MNDVLSFFDHRLKKGEKEVTISFRNGFGRVQQNNFLSILCFWHKYKVGKYSKS